MDKIAVPKATEIHGVTEFDLKEVETDGGPVLHMMRADGPMFERFGEIYFSVVLPGAVKAWKRHRMQTQHLAVPIGLVDIVIYDSRPDSPTHGKLARFQLGRPGNYRLLSIKPGKWYRLTGKSAEPSVLANCVDIPHAPEESERLPKDTDRIPFQWE